MPFRRYGYALFFAVTLRYAAGNISPLLLRLRLIFFAADAILLIATALILMPAKLIATAIIIYVIILFATFFSRLRFYAMPP